MKFVLAQAHLQICIFNLHNELFSGRLFASGDSRGKITRSSRSFIEAYQPAQFYIVSEKTYPEQQLGKTQIKFIPPAEVSATVLA